MDGADESREAVEELICALVSIGIAGLLDGLGAGEVAASMRFALNIGASRVSDAFKRDLERILERNAREVRDDASSSSSQTAADAAADESVWSDEEHERKTAAHDGAVRAQTFVSRACGEAAVQTVTSYQRVLNGMAHDINTIGYERAAKAAMRRFEDAGITCAVYDRNGRKVRLSLQAVVNRELSSIGNRALFDQTISLAKRTGDNLVEVNTTANCRESHASWQGGIYQLEGSGEHRNFYTACKWGDPVNGIGGYNCGHRFRIYRPSDGRRFEDPLDGTGYTTEDARRLKGAQRRYERIIRNAKLEIEAIERSGIDDATKAELKRAARARMADARTRMNMLIAEHPKLLKREQWREMTYTQNAGGYGGLSNAKPQGPVPGIERQSEHGDAEQIRDGVHRNGVTFVEYKGHKADYGTHRLPNGGTFVGPSRERAVELLKDTYGGGMEESSRAGRKSQNRGIIRSPEYDVAEKTVNSRGYRKAIASIFGDDAAEGAETAIRRMLSHRGGTNGEDLYAINLDDGSSVSSVVNSRVRSQVEPTKKFNRKVAKVIDEGGRIALIHNHPGSSVPSTSDLNGLLRSNAEFGVIACHDGSFYIYRESWKHEVGYKVPKDAVEFIHTRFMASSEESFFGEIDIQEGFRIEHIVGHIR